MKNIFTLLLSLAVLMYNAQNLTLGEVVELRKKDANEVINTLKAKGWEYNSFKRGELGKATVVEFMYLQGSKNDPAQVIESSFTHYFFGNGISRVSFTTFNSTKFGQYMNQIINVYKCKELPRKSIEANDGNRYTTRVFQGATTTFMVSLVDMSDLTYSFTLVSNKDYNENIR